MADSLFIRYLLEFSSLLPACVLCYLPMGGSLRSVKGAVAAVSMMVMGFILGGAGLCTALALPGKMLILPCMMLNMAVLWHVTRLPLCKVFFVCSISTAVTAIVSWGGIIYGSAFELSDRYVGVAAWETSLVIFAAECLVVLLMTPLMRKKVRWLLEHFDDVRVWQVAWVFPTILTVVLIICMPQDYGGLQMNRYRPIGVGFAVMLLLLLIGFMVFFCYMAQVLTDRATLEQEKQLLTIQREHYDQMHAWMKETRRLRHDFRQHLRVIVGLAEKEQYAELHTYLKEYESEMKAAPVQLCTNAAVDAIAQYYDRQARRDGICVSWLMELPERLPLPESDLCMILGNLVENAIHATSKLPEQERRIDVICRMLSEGMVGLNVQNTWDSAGKHHEKYPQGEGIGMKSVAVTVKKYEGTFDIHAESEMYSVRLLLNVPMAG